MLQLVLAIGIALWPGPAEAITWHFDDGTTQGWAAKQGFAWGGLAEFNLFPGQVKDGVWTIDVSPSVAGKKYPTPSVQVISSTIGYESGLFDRVRVRLRTVHHRPTVGSFLLAWTNEHNRTAPGRDPASLFSNRFSLPGQGGFVYTTEWQEVEFTLPVSDGEVAPGEREVWEGLLRDIRLSFSLDWGESDVPRSAAEVVGWLEIDWIELTGMDELLAGELAPPSVEYFRFEGAGLFAPPVFSSIMPEFRPSYLLGGNRAGGLVDLDGDGDLDLFSTWEDLHRDPFASGWVMALNDGRGAFETVRIEENSGEGIPNLRIGDLTGDGIDEIATDDQKNWEITVWSIEPELQIEVLTQINDRWLVDMVDWDGDGRVELFTIDFTVEEERALEVWEAEQGVWTVSQVAVVENHWPSRIGDFTGDGVLDVLWEPIGQAGVWMVARLGDAPEAGDRLFEYDAESTLFFLLRAGDFDGDGQVDLLMVLEHNLWEQRKGLVMRRSQPAGGLAEEVIYDGRLFVRSPVVVRDLNGDGVDDWVFVGGDRASGLGVFVEWGGGANPAKEVETHRLAGDGVQVLPGDVDGDGDLDLVVLDPILGGVHVLKSSVGEQPTAVMTPAAARPAQHRLGDSYPNPFNPAVVLPLDLATDAAGVSLTVYDVLGRRVRQVWDGSLRAGSHRFTWDGRDATGKAVAAGVYIYQVEVDGQVEAKKTTKLP